MRSTSPVAGLCCLRHRADHLGELVVADGLDGLFADQLSAGSHHRPERRLASAILPVRIGEQHAFGHRFEDAGQSVALAARFCTVRWRLSASRSSASASAPTSSLAAHARAHRKIVEHGHGRGPELADRIGRRRATRAGQHGRDDEREHRADPHEVVRARDRGVDGGERLRQANDANLGRRDANGDVDHRMVDRRARARRRAAAAPQGIDNLGPVRVIFDRADVVTRDLGIADDGAVGAAISVARAMARRPSSSANDCQSVPPAPTRPGVR